MLTMIKARLRDPRLYTVVVYITLLGLTAWIAPRVGVRGEDLRMLLSAQGGVGMLLAWLLRSPLHKDAAQPSGNPGELDGDA